MATSGDGYVVVGADDGKVRGGRQGTGHGTSRSNPGARACQQGATVNH